MPPTSLSAVHPSPKRKRNQPPPVPLLNTALRPASTPPRGSPTISGSDSPSRNAVADQLRGMSLTNMTAVPTYPLSPTDDVAHKKPKLDMARSDSGTSLAEQLTQGIAKPLEAGIAANTDIARRIAFASGDTEDIPEIPETPQASTQPRIVSDFATFSRSVALVSFTENKSTQSSTSSHQEPGSQSTTAQPRHRTTKSPSPPLSTLTWQDSEITGHLADPTKDPDDDGTGLNGIGFRPTPAIAYVRAQKRRQQILDWKAREAREARAKRSERRRRGVGGRSSREQTLEREIPAPPKVDVRRSVKFAV